MSIKIVQVSDGFASATVPSVNDVTGASVLQFMVSGSDITNGYYLLPVAATNPTSSILIWQGVGQQYGVDYEINGIQLAFLSPLLALLSDNDFMVLYYN